MGVAHRNLSNRIYNFDIGNISCLSGVSRILAFNKGDPVSQGKPVYQVDVALMQVNGTIVGQAMGRRLVHRADQSPG